MLHRNGFHPSQAQLGVLLDRTEGWAAGLRLAVMCLDPADLDRRNRRVHRPATDWSPNT